MYQVVENIPNGTYKLSIGGFVNVFATGNSSTNLIQYVFANSDKTPLTSSQATAYEVYTYVTDNRMEIGIEQVQAIANWMGIDNVSLAYYGTEDVTTELRDAYLIPELQSRLTAKQAEATALLANTDYANVTGEERTNLQSLSTATPTEQTVVAYEELIENIATAMDAFKAAKALADNTATVAGASISNSVLTSFVVNGEFNNGNTGWSSTGGFDNQGIATNQQGDFTGGFWENWHPSAKVNKMYQVIENIPNGTYKLRIAAFVYTFAEDNSAPVQYVYANSDKTALTERGPLFYEVYTYVDNNRIEIGLEQTQAITQWMGIDNISLTYYGATNVVNDLLMGADKIAWNEAVAAAQAALATYSATNDPSKAALEALLAEPEPNSPEAYRTAANNITAATSTFTTAAQAYNAAKAALAEEIAYATQLGVSTVDAQAVYDATTSTAADFIAAIEPLKVLEYNTLVGEGTEYTQDVTSSYIALWTGNIGNANGQHWSGDNRSYFDRWSGSAAVYTLSQNVTLPAGDYLFMLAGRGASNVNAVTFTVGETTVSYTRKGDQGYGIDTSGKTNFSAEGTYANNNNGRGWEWRYIVCSLTEETTLNVEMKLDLVGNSWGSFTDMRILAKPTPEMAKVALQNAIASAQTVIDGVTPAVGTGVFMIPESAKTTLEAAKTTAQGVYDNAAATVAEIEAATTAMNEAIATFNATPLNAPAVDGMYYLQLTDEGFEHKANVITFTPRTDTSGAYNMGYNEPAGSAYNQAIMFEAAEGVNEYYMYVVNAAGEKHYVCTGVNYGGNNSQLRTTTDVSKALALRVVRNGADLNFVNTMTNTNVGSNGDKGFFTANNYSKYAVTDYQKITFPFTVKAEKYSTVIFPFLPTATDYEGVTFYTCESVSGTEVVLTEATELEADKPYIVKNNTSDLKNFTTDIVGRAYSQNLTSGLLTGLYTNATVPAGAYVLQTQGEKQCFYIVPEGGMTGVAFRAYLTYNGANAVNRFDFQGTDATGIHAVDALLNGEGAEAIYDASGARIAAPQKGLNIIKMSNGKTVKVMIK